MIWRFLVRCSQSCSFALKRCLIGVILLTATGTATTNSALAIAPETFASNEATALELEALGHLSLSLTTDEIDLPTTASESATELTLPLPDSDISETNKTSDISGIAAIAPTSETVTVFPEAQEQTLGVSALVEPPLPLEELDSEELDNLSATFTSAELAELTALDLDSGEDLDLDEEPTNSENLEEKINSAAIAPSVLLSQRPNSNTEPLPEIQPLPDEPDATPTLEENNPPLPEITDPEITDPEITDIEATVAVSNVQVVGSTVFDEEDFAPILAELSRPEPTPEELSRAADQITALYLEQGYITSRAVVVEREVITGKIIEIQVIEGKVDDINITGNDDLNDGYLLSRLRLGAKQPLNTSSLEDQLRLLKLSPGIENIEATLKAGDGLGESDLDIIVTEADTVSLNVGIDNFSPASVGSVRITTDFIQQNLTGSADRLGVGYIRTAQGGADSLDINYNRPINAKNGTIGLRAVLSSNEVIQAPFDTLNIRGESDRYEISYRQPLIRNPREEFALGVSLTYQDGLTFLGDELFGFNVGTENGTSTTTIVKFSQDYIKRQPTGAWSLRSQFSFGTDWFEATQNAGDTPDGQFWSWLGQIQRVRLINPNNLLVVQADIQLTPDTLLPSQQFVIGGGQSLRGFRQNARSADNGFRFSIEDRMTLARDEAGDAVFQLAPFFDMGTVWNSDNNPNVLPTQRFLAGLGLGVWWQMEKGLTLRFDYALPLVDLSDRSDDMQDDGLYFDINYLF